MVEEKRRRQAGWWMGKKTKESVNKLGSLSMPMVGIKKPTDEER